MSLRDDTIIRNERGQIVKGSGGLHRKSEQPPPPPPDLDATFDEDLIAAANSFGRPRTKQGRRAWCEALRDERPVEFAALLRPALARAAEVQAAVATGISGVRVVMVGSIPPNHYLPGDTMRALMSGELQLDAPDDAEPPLADNVIAFNAPEEDE